MNGQVFWITGLPGAGKTTIAKALYEVLKPQRPELVYLDGDMLRDVFRNYRYDLASRKELALSYSRMCHLLSRQGHSVICATVSLFHQVHQWNRQNIDKYQEIYLDVPLDVLRHRNQKGLYLSAGGECQKNVYGLDIAFETPERPDFIIHNDGRENLDKIVTTILEGIS